MNPGRIMSPIRAMGQPVEKIHEFSLQRQPILWFTCPYWLFQKIEHKIF